MNQPVMRFIDYSFVVTSAGDIVMDEELDPKALNIVAGDRFEAVLVPDAGLVFKKIKAV